MVRCGICGKELTLPFTCKGCKKQFCIAHRFPEGDNCHDLGEVRKTILPGSEIVKGIDYEKNGENLKPILLEIKRLLNNDDYFVVLVDKVCDKLPLKIQQIIMQLINSN